MKPAPGTLSQRRPSRRALLASAAALLQPKRPRVFVVPNFHPASCGWLTNFSMERVYCANSYFDHLDRTRDDPRYAFLLSEVNNIVAMLNFQPQRAAELKSQISRGRVELVNAYFLESTINLSGGEALVRLGVEGLRWQRKMFNARPRFSWNIDVCGTHCQMAQIAAGLGLEALVYCRKNPTGSAVHYAQSPDGTRILALSPGHYSEFRPAMRSADPLDAKQIAEVEADLAAKLKITPPGAPILVLAGGGDYALAPLRKQFPSEFLDTWNANPAHPEIRFSTLSPYLDEIQSLLKSGAIKIPTMTEGTEFDFDAFWIENPRVKSAFRRAEHQLQSAEALSTAASLLATHTYPAQDLYHAWCLLFLNMDRNTLWGSAGGMVFEHQSSWDVNDRFNWLDTHCRKIAEAATAALLPSPNGSALFNPLNWRRHDPVALPDGNLVQPAIEPFSFAAIPTPAPFKPVPLAPIETKHYTARIDAQTGALSSLKLKPSGREMLAGPANTIVAEKPNSQKGDPGDFMVTRPNRTQLDSTSQHPPTIRARQSRLATIVEIDATLLGQPCRRTLAFYNDHPRIDCTTELNDVPDRTVVVAEFPLSGPISTARRGIPYGFALDKPNAIVPAVRWSHYQLEGAGAAILDRGLSGRELNASTPILYLLNATDKYYGYPNSWLSGKGRHKLEYALVFHAGAWPEAQIPHRAWEFNAPPLALPAHPPSTQKPFLTTSPNVIVEALRRLEGHIEVRLAEALGLAGQATVTLNLPHTSAALTNLTGANPQPLPSGPLYTFPIRPQQIVTLRFRTATEVPEPEVITKWDPLVPPEKLPMLHRYSSEKGHPPRGN